MKKLIINLLCAEIVRLQKLVNTDGKEVLQEQCETSAKAMLRQGVEIQKLRAEIKELKEQLSNWKQNYHDSLQAKQRAELDLKKCFSENEKLQATNYRQFEWNQENVKKIKELENENKDLRAYKEANTVSVKLDTKQVEELLQEAKHNVFALKDKNERLEKWDKEHRQKIEVLEAANSLLNHMLTNFGDTERSELLSKVVELEKENENFKQIISEKEAIIEESSKKWQSAAWQILIAKTDKVPKWKNSVKDGLPVLKIGDFIMIRKMQGSFSFSDHEIDDETTKEKVYKEFLYGGEFDYFVFNLYENATN